MNIHFTSKNKRFFIFFFVIWIIYSAQMYLFVEKGFWESITHGLIYSALLNTVFYLTGMDAQVIYCKPEYENEIRSEIETLGFSFVKSKNEYDIYQKKKNFFSKKIRIKKTAFNIQIAIPAWMNHPFDAYSQSHMEPM